MVDIIDEAKRIVKMKPDEGWCYYRDFCTEEEWRSIHHSNNWLRLHHYPMCSKKKRRNIKRRIGYGTVSRICEMAMSNVNNIIAKEYDDIVHFGKFAEYKETRPATEKELDSINKYIKSISVPTGVNFYDF